MKSNTPKRVDPALASSIRLYNLFPLLAENLSAAASHFPRIAAMGFDWVFLNPVHRTGGSRSLYAVESYDEIDPRFAVSDDLSLEANFPLLTKPAKAAGLGIMMDLVLNHTADSHPFTREKPHWYARDAEGRIMHPSAIDPGGGQGQVWGDLVELDYHGNGRDQITAYFTGYLKRLIKLGITGFRCDAAYKVPAEVWSTLIAAARDANPNVVFAAETLGCRLDEIEALAGVGFDYIFNSSKWWDLQSPWAVEQYNQFRTIAPSIAFPESHDTPRLPAETGGDATLAIQRYAVAACFSSGVMMPMGYEYGFTRPLSVTDTTAGDWDIQSAEKRYDISAEIAAINAMKSASPALLVEGEMEFRRFASGLSAIARYDASRTYVSLLVANPLDHAVWIERECLCEWLQIPSDDLLDITPGRNEAPETARLELPTNGYRVFETIHNPDAVRTYETPESQPIERHRDWNADARIAIEHIYPEIDGGRFPAKRIVGDRLDIWADILVDGHEKLAAEIVWRQGRRKGRSRLRAFDNDRWRGDVFLSRMGRLFFTIEAWVDTFETWRWDTLRKYEAKQAIHLELGEGRHLLVNAETNANVVGRKAIQTILKAFDAAESDDEKARILFSPETRRFLTRWGQRDYLTRLSREIEIIVDRERATNGAWYEMFQRSQGSDPGKSATFDDCIGRLPYVRDLGFDVVYLVPIHPIGLTHRKGKDNTLTPGPDDPGSPYAIGGPMGDGRMGGHMDIHPDLGTLEDFRRFVAATREHGMEVAIDFAIQCSMDHPWVKEHPDWFFWREDGTIKYAENPPKKYQDIVNVNFFGPHRQALWNALRDVILFWVEQGVDIFRVDNPHTKPLPFWEWMIREVQAKHPQTIFLAEAFTRPKMMAELAKCGFTQSYTYFTWRNTKLELTEYLTELTRTELREYYRPNFFVNTPDILPTFLQSGKRSAFMLRAALAALLTSTWGMYNGYELCEGAAVPGKEEYLHSEKYEYKVWDWDRPGNIRDYIRKLNETRRRYKQLQTSLGLRFHSIHDDRVLLFSRDRPGVWGVVFVAVMLDPDGYFEADITLPLAEAGMTQAGRLTITEPLHDREYASDHGAVHINLHPDYPAQVFAVR
jgi:starch synthase (maltosyl-transferring)